LISADTSFAALIAEYGNKQQENAKRGVAGGMITSTALEAAAQKEAAMALMQAEERNTGAVSWDIYKKYMRSAGGLFWAPLILTAIVLNEAAQGSFIYTLEVAVLLMVRCPSR
jgi:ATP-binding cassette, subfamily C (CFTR/MRP), member 1